MEVVSGEESLGAFCVLAELFLRREDADMLLWPTVNEVHEINMGSGDQLMNQTSSRLRHMHYQP